MSYSEKNWKVCSNCGKHLLREDNLIDTVYPCNREKTKFNAYCNSTMGGCGRIVYEENLEKLQDRWNQGITDEMEEQFDFPDFN